MTRRTDEQLDQSEKDRRIERRSAADPIPEPSYSVSTKRTDTEAINEAQEAYRYPFQIKPHAVTSRLVSVPRRKLGLGENLIINPTSIETSAEKFGDRSQFDPETDLPRFQIWESARIKPIPPLHERFETVEVGLPPRNLMRVAPMEDGSEGSEARADASGEVVPEQREEDRERTEENETSAAVSEENPGGNLSQDLPDIYDLLFQSSEESSSIREPICIVAETRDSERYRQTLETLCREEFRQNVGGRPLADLLTSGEADSVEAVRVQNRVVSYDDTESDFFEFVSRLDDEQRITRELIEEEGEADLDRLHARLDEFFTQSLGYLLLFVDETFAGALHEHLTSTDEIRESVVVRQVRARELPDDVKRELVRLAWSFVPLEKNSRDLDTLFHTGEMEFKREIEPEQAVVEEITRRHQGEESQLHYLLKCFVVDVQLREESLIPSDDPSWDKMQKRVQTETQPWAKSKVQPDVYNPQTKEAFEIETLYGSDHRKINRTIEKYQGVNVKRINVVIPNLTCLRNLQDVHRKTREEFGGMFQNKVRFWTLDVANRELLPVEVVVDRVVELHERSEGY
jgi:hypothetical protein